MSPSRFGSTSCVSAPSASKRQSRTSSPPEATAKFVPRASGVAPRASGRPGTIFGVIGPPFAARARSRLLCRNSVGTDQHSRHEITENESADVGEESDAAAAAVPVHERIVAFEELVQEPAAQEYPRRDSHREPQQERADARVRIEHQIRT